MNNHTPPRWFARLVGEDNARHMPRFVPYIVASSPVIGAATLVAHFHGWLVVR